MRNRREKIAAFLSSEDVIPDDSDYCYEENKLSKNKVEPSEEEKMDVRSFTLALKQYLRMQFLTKLGRGLMSFLTFHFHRRSK